MNDFKRIDVTPGEAVFIPQYLFIGKVRLLKNGDKRIYLYAKSPYRNNALRGVKEVKDGS